MIVPQLTSFGDPDGTRIVTINGEFTAQSLTTDGKGGLAIKKSDGGSAIIPLNDIVEIRFAGKSSGESADKEAIRLQLVNGDIVAGKLGKDDPNGIVTQSTSLGSLTVPFDIVRSVYFHGKSAEGEREEIDTSKGDVLKFVSGDEDRGRVVSVGKDGVKFKSNQADETVIAIDKIASFHLESLGASKVEAPKGMCGEIALADGSRVTAAISAIKADAIEAKALCKGVALPAIKRENVLSVAVKNSRLVYLSDLKPLNSNERPYIEGDGAIVFTYQLDRSICAPSKPISVGGVAYRKGIGVHAYSLIVYKLNKEYSRFSTVAGLDDTAEGQGSVEFKVYGDKNKLFESGLVVGEKLKGQHPNATTGAKTINVDVSGVDELMLVVDFGPDTDMLDRAAWANATLIKK